MHSLILHLIYKDLVLDHFSTKGLVSIKNNHLYFPDKKND